MIPLFKKGSKLDPGNYRPVSLTCVSCKIMESIIKVILLTYFQSYEVAQQISMVLPKVIPVQQICSLPLNFGQAGLTQVLVWTGHCLP